MRIKLLNITVSFIVIITGVNLYAQAYVKSFSVESDKLLIELSETGANPVLLTSYYPSRNSAQTSSTFTTPKESALLQAMIPN